MVGVLLNPLSTQAGVDSTLAFEKIDISNVRSFKLNQKPDAIGYDWKEYIGGLYSIQFEYNYIINTQKGSFHKMRFVDFYDSKGNKGTPTFEYQRL